MTCDSIMWSMVACSMQSGLSSVSVKLSSTFDVSNNGGKYGQRRSTLNTRFVGKGRGEYSIQKHCHPHPWWWCKAKWTKLPIGSYEVLFLQMKPNLVAHLEFGWNLLMGEKIPRNKGGYCLFHKSQLDSWTFDVVGPMGLWPRYHSRGVVWWDLKLKNKRR